MIGHKNESEFWRSLKPRLDKLLPGSHVERYENAVGAGTADVNVCVGGKETWAELKIFNGRKIKFRASQKPWILKRHGAGGRVVVLVRDDRGVVSAYRAHELVCRCAVLPGDFSGKSFVVCPDLCDVRPFAEADEADKDSFKTLLELVFS